jgi:hypothetical protein
MAVIHGVAVVCGYMICVWGGNISVVVCVSVEVEIESSTYYADGMNLSKLHFVYRQFDVNICCRL